MPDHQQWMRYAIRMGEKAEALGEVPIGAVLVKDNKCIAEGWNNPIASHDASAHAEIMALRKGGLILENYRLVDCALYVTLEPCVMCMGAIMHARVKSLIFGAFDAKRGAVCSALHLSDAAFLNHHVEWSGGILEDRCSLLLKDFFKARR